MTGHIKIGGTWKDVDSIHAKVGGSWKDVDAGYVKVSGAWEQFYSAVPTLTVDYLVVAGGGGGGGFAGGAGAGGYRTSAGTSGGGASAESSLTLTAGTSYTVTVGAGGTKSTSTSVFGANGANSVFSTITSTGGGGTKFNTNGASGGSGGGGHHYGTSGGAGTANQGFDGGDGTATSSTGGAGGGGAAQAGFTPAGPQANGADGGDGVASSITGSSTTRAGGGGGGADALSGALPSAGNTGGTGGTGGGGTGSNGSSAGTDGTANTGGGGGGGGRNSSGSILAGGNGGSGVVIVKYPDTYAISVGAGLTSSTSTSGGYRVTTFTSGTGSISFQDASEPPAFLSTAPLWLDASDASTITESSGSVSQWSNKGTASNVVQASASLQPSTGIETINGLNTITFDGSALVLDGTYSEFNFLHDGSTFFIAAVLDWVPAADANNFLVTTRRNASADTGYAVRNDNRTSLSRTNRLITDVSRGVAGTLSAEIIVDNYFNSGSLIYSSIVDANASTGSRILYWQNNTQGGNTNTRTDAPNTGNSSYLLTVGSSGDLTDNMSGKVGEIIIVNGSDATEANRQAVVDYLNAKWGVF